MNVRRGPKTGLLMLIEICNYCVWLHRNVIHVSTLSEVSLVFCILPRLNILCTSSMRRLCSLDSYRRCKVLEFRIWNLQAWKRLKRGLGRAIPRKSDGKRDVPV